MKKKVLYSIAALSLSAGVASAVLVDPIDVGLYNTGVDHAGDLLVQGDDDDHFLLKDSSNTAVTPMADTLRHPLWVVPGDTEHQWVSPDGMHSNVDPDEWVYTTTFNLSGTGVDASTAVLYGRWSADNAGSVFLNTAEICCGSIAGPQGYTNYHDFAVSGFVDGVNTLSFKVLNQLGGNNPTGLLVDFISIPEPTSMGLLVVMSGGIIFCRRAFRR